MNEFNSENGRIHLFNMDCMEYMAQFPDNYFELAIVDPPYGVDISNQRMGVGVGIKCSKIENRIWVGKGWDKTPPPHEYFTELFRVSKNQIIFGGNYFQPQSRYFCIWDKGEGLRGRSFAECEYAWVRSGGTRIFKVNPVQLGRFHPTQKPIKLYEWLLKSYANDGDKILDTHLGSASSAIAAHRMGFEFFGTELDGDYFAASIERFERETAQLDMFAEVAHG